MDQSQLKSLGILQWSEIQNDYDHPDILLGNGFSISFSRNFDYASLFRKFATNPGTQNVALFEQFGTPNFEEIMAILTHARSVNHYLGLEVDRIDKAIIDLRNGLVSTVGLVHPQYKELDPSRVARIAESLDSFGNIYTTTYDAIPYYLILAVNDRIKGTKAGQYQDYFWQTMGGNPYTEFRDFQHYPEYKHIYYLHGALFIFRGGSSAVKLKATSGDGLLAMILKKISNGHMPLFVSEGTKEQKQQAIDRSSYLSFCLHNLRNNARDILIYGMSFGDNDEHLVEAIQANKARSLIIAIYPDPAATPERLNLRMAVLREKFIGQGEVRFIDSRSVFV